MRRRLDCLLALLFCLPLCLASFCEGNGSSGSSRVRIVSGDPRCTAIVGTFPSGLALMPGGKEALVMQFRPADLLAFDLRTSPPRSLSPGSVGGLGSDSDGDGVDDVEAHRALGLCHPANPLCTVEPEPGSLLAVSPTLALLSTSAYEEVAFLDPLTGDLTGVLVGNPPARGEHDPADHPLLPPGGQTALRTAVSTRACVYPPSPFDSEGGTIVHDTRCTSGAPGFLTRFTAGKALAAGRLFVATSNKRAGSTYYPGTTLVFEYDGSGAVPFVQVEDERPVLHHSAFNPTALTRHTNAQGRELVLVTLTGALGLGAGPGTVRSPSAIDVIDAASAEIVATIPLGHAGLGFGRMAIDPSGRLALIGSATQRNVYAIDLAALDDPALYARPGLPPVLLDGRSLGFPDARIRGEIDPLPLEHLAEGPPEHDCGGQLDLAWDEAAGVAYATDWCDGTLSVIDVDLDSPGGVPLSADRLSVRTTISLVAPQTAANYGRLSAPSAVRVRPGVPGVDYVGPNVVFLADLPEGHVCTVSVSP